MNRFRNWFCCIGALTLAMFPLTSTGDPSNKHFRLDVAPLSISNSQVGTTLTATITNDNPSGSSAQIGSFTIRIDDNVTGLVITNAVAEFDSQQAFGGTVTWDATTVTVLGIGPLKATDHYSVTVTVSGCGEGNAWAGTSWTGPSLNGTSYDDSGTGSEAPDISCGLVACNASLAGTTVGAILGNDSKRGPLNQDGACPTTNAVNYFVTNLLADTEKYLHVKWDTQTQPDAVLYYTVSSLLVTPASPPPFFAWKTSAGDPIFVKGQKCYGGTAAAAPYVLATLLSDTGGKNIKVAPSVTPPLVPFPIVLGPKPIEEYLTVTKANGQIWTVTRGQNASAHPANIAVMSTPKVPLPTPVTCYSNAGAQTNPPVSMACPAGTYVAGAPTQMCYVDPPAGSNPLKVFDIGDGYVKPST